MSKTIAPEQRSELVRRIQKYDDLISGYLEEDTPKSETELEQMTTDQLEKWLNTRTTYYQFQVDDDIEANKYGCQN